MKSLAILPVFLWLLPAFAQVGINSNTMLKGSDQAPMEEAIGSGRFEVKTGLPEVAKDPVKVKKQPRKSARKISSEMNEKEDVKIVKTEVIESPISEPTVAEQVKDLVLGNPQPSVESYKEQIHPDDIRLNKLEISILPGYLYVDSKSSFSYREHVSASPYAQIGSRIWFTPMIGIFGNYGQSFGADIVEGSTEQRRIEIAYEHIDLGLDFRKFFGLSRRSNSASFGIHYFEYNSRVPGDNTKRVRTKSNGMGIQFSSRFPIAPSFAWILGGRIEPKISHAELPTGLDLKSGSGVESSRFGLNVGSEFKLSRQHQMLLDLSLNVEKNQFSGTANYPDAESGLTASGVSVTNSQVLFTLGYRWGQ